MTPLTLNINGTSVTDSRMAFRTPIKIKFEGIGYDVIYSGTPTGRKVKYLQSGQLLFAQNKVGKVYALMN